MSYTPNDDLLVVINGVPFGGWMGVQVTQTFDQAAGDGTLRMSPQPGVPLPVMLGDKIAVICANQPASTGHIHRIWGEHEISSHVIQAQFRCKTQDFVDSTIGPKLNVNTPVSLAQVARKTLAAMHLDGIGVIDMSNSEPFQKGEKVSGAIDETGHGFVDNWAKMRNVVQRTDGKGNLVLDRNNGKRLAGGYIHFGLPDDPLNNALKSSFGIEDFNRHNMNAVSGQKSPNDKNFWEGRPKGDPLAQAKTMANRYGVAHDTSVRPERRKHHRGGKGQQGKTPKEAAKWKTNTLRAKSNEYVATVPGFTTSTGNLWWPGYIAPVYDYWWNVAADLFIKEVVFSKDWASGSKTQIKFGMDDSFKDQSGRNKASGRSGSKLPGDPGGKYAPAEHDIDDAEVDVDKE